MRIRAFHLDAFGPLRDVAAEGLPAGFAVFLGRNEAGKSTLLDFFRSTLTGYPRKPRDLREKAYASGGQGSGGSLVLDTEQGFIRLTRRPGADRLSLADAAGNPLDEALWERLLGGVTREVYASVYGFSLSELQTFNSLTTEGVRNALYGASFGMGLRSPGAALKRLDSAMEPLFKPGGSRPQLSAALRAWEDMRKAVRAAEDEAARYDDLAAALEEQGRALALAREERSGLEQERRALERRLGVWRQWEEWRLAGARLERLEAVPATFPQDGPARLERALERRESAAREAALALERVERTRGELAACAVDEALAAASETLRELAGRKASCRNALIAVPELSAALDRLGTELERELGTLGEGWTLERVTGVERPLALRETIESRAGALREATAVRDAAASVLEKTAREREEALEALERARRTHASLPVPAAELGDAEREELRRQLERAEEAGRRLPEREKALDNARQEFNRALNHLHLRPRQSTIEALEALSSAQEEALRRAAEALACLAAQDEARRRADRAGEDESRSRERFERLRGEQEGAGDPDRAALDARRRDLRALRAVSDRLSLEKNRLSEAEERLAAHLAECPGADRSLPLIGIGGLLALAGAAALAGRYLWGVASLPLTAQFTLPLESWLGYLVFLAGVAFMGAGLPRKRPEAARHAAVAEQLRTRVAAAAAGVRAGEEEAAGLGARLGLDAPDRLPAGLGRDGLDELEAELDREREQCAAGERLARAVAEHEAELEALRRRAQELSADYAATSAAVQTARRRWHEYLMDFGVQSVPLPEDAAAFFARVDGARMVWSGVAALEKEVAEMESRGTRLVAAARDMLPPAAWPSAPSGEAPLADVMAAARRVLESCRQADLAIEERTRAAEALRGAEARAERVRRAEAEAAEALRGAEAALAGSVDAWEETMRGLGLSERLSPATARQALECMDRVLSLEAERARCAAELRRQERERDALLAPLKRLLAQLGRPPAPAAPKAGPDWLVLLDDLLRASEANRSRAETRTLLEARKAEQEGELHRAEAVLADAARAVDWLLRMAEAADPEDFLRRHEVKREREALIRRREDLEDALRLAAEDTARLAGAAGAERPAGEDEPGGARAPGGSHREAGERFRAFVDGFAETEQDERSSRLKDVEARLAVLAEEEAGLADAVRTGEVRLASLASSDRLAALRLEEAALVETIRGLALEWSRYALARRLLTEARNRFEQERQPEVVRLASALFAEITDGRWQSVNASLEDSSLKILPARGPAVSPELLSRGTREQLYLALRLAYIRSHAARAVPLPVIMDDVLVNFDPERADRTARALGSLCDALDGAPAHQVLFFTCHPHTAHRLRERIPGCGLYELENGAIRELD